MLRTIVAFIIGVFVAMLVITGIEYLGMQLYPPPPGFDWTNKQAIAAFAANMPMPAMLLVVSGWCLGGFFGAAVPAWQANHRVPAAVLIGLLVAAGTYANSQMIPHPQWMLIAGTVGPIVLSWLATVVIRARRLPPPPPSSWPGQASRR